MKPFNRQGYFRIQLHKNQKNQTYSVHRLVAEAFIPNPDNKPLINHKNTQKDDNRVENLEWCTQRENIQHSWKMGLQRCNTKKIIQYDLQGNLIKEWESIVNAERQLGIDHSNISSCCLKRYGFKTAGGYIWKFKDTQ